MGWGATQRPDPLSLNRLRRLEDWEQPPSLIAIATSRALWETNVVEGKLRGGREVALRFRTRGYYIDATRVESSRFSTVTLRRARLVRIVLFVSIAVSFPSTSSLIGALAL